MKTTKLISRKKLFFQNYEINALINQQRPHTKIQTISYDHVTIIVNEDQNKIIQKVYQNTRSSNTLTLDQTQISVKFQNRVLYAVELLNDRIEIEYGYYNP